MVKTRIDSDPDLRKFSKQLHRLDDAELISLVVQLCRRAGELLQVEEQLATEALDVLDRGSLVPLSLQEMLHAAAETADDLYLDVLDVEGADSERCLNLFGKARFFTAVDLACTGDRMSYLEAIYEVILGTQRNTHLLAIVEGSCPSQKTNPRDTRNPK